MATSFPIEFTWDAIVRLCDVELKTPLNLKSVIKGDLTSQPTPGILNLVNGIWVHPSPALENVPEQIPRVMIQTHNFRLVYLRRMALNENPTVRTMQDAVVIGDKMTEKYKLPDVTNMPSGSQILWMLVKSIEFEPQEDDLVSTIAADIRACALQVEVVCRVSAPR